MTWYRDIQPLQEPFDLGEVDDAARVQLVFHVIATKRPSSTFLEELFAILEKANVGRRRVDLFGGSLATVPSTGRYLSIKVEQGPGPQGTHNDGVGAYRKPGARILVGAETMPEAELMAQAAYKALTDCRNREVQIPA